MAVKPLIVPSCRYIHLFQRVCNARHNNGIVVQTCFWGLQMAFQATPPPLQGGGGRGPYVFVVQCSDLSF